MHSQLLSSQNQSLNTEIRGLDYCVSKPSQQLRAPTADEQGLGCLLGECSQDGRRMQTYNSSSSTWRQQSSACR